MESCDFCKQGVNTIFKEFTKPDIIITTEIYFMGVVCPQMPNIDDCRIGLTKYWDRIAHLIFSEDVADYVCNNINPVCSSIR